MPLNLILNSNNLVATDPFQSTYKYKFPTGSARLGDNQEIAVTSVGLYYSWFNVTSASTGGQYGNNFLSYVWIDGTTHNITITDGFYDTNALSNYVQTQMVANGHYLMNGTSIVTFIQFVSNATYYATQLNCFAVPSTSTLPAGYTNPASITLPATPTTPQLVIAPTSTSAFYKLVGMTPGTYPPTQQSTTYSHLSDFTPQASPVSSLIMTCNMLNNRYAQPNTLLFSFNISNVSFGSLISVSPPQFNYVDIQPGSYVDFSIGFLDQNLGSVAIRDPQVCIVLSIRSKNDPS